jgi:hypothetical protein
VPFKPSGRRPAAVSEHLATVLSVPVRVSIVVGVLGAAATLPRLSVPAGGAPDHRRRAQAAHLLTGVVVGLLPVGVVLAVLPFFNGISPSLLLITVAAFAVGYRVAIGVADVGARLAYGVDADAAHDAVAPALRPLVHVHLACTVGSLPVGLWLAGLL